MNGPERLYGELCWWEVWDPPPLKSGQVVAVQISVVVCGTAVELYPAAKYICLHLTIRFFSVFYAF